MVLIVMMIMVMIVMMIVILIVMMIIVMEILIVVMISTCSPPPSHLDLRYLSPRHHRHR